MTDLLLEDDQLAIAPFALLRAAALPLRMLEDLRLPETEARIGRILAAEQTMAAQRQAVADALYAAVPAIAAGDAATRRRVLALRRDVYNERAAAITAPLRELVRALLHSAADVAAFDAWADAREAHAQALGELEDGVRHELQHVVRPAMRQPLANVLFRRGLAFASPGVERSASRETRLPGGAAPDNFERSLLGYMVRAAAKTSPFSSFMSLSVLDLAPARHAPLPAVPDPRYRNTVHFNRGEVARLYRLALVDAARAGDLPLHCNPTLRAGANGRMHGLCGREVVLLGRPWWEQRFAQFRLEPALWDALRRTGEASWQAWTGVLRGQGVDEATAEATIVKLIERGVLVPPDLSDGFDPDPLARLVAAWSRSASTGLRERVPALGTLQRQVLGVAQSQGQQRIALLDAVRGSVQALEAGFAAPAAEPLQNLVLEDCWLDGLAGQAGTRLLAPLADLRDFLSGQVIESGYYRRLRDQFVARYGEGGECTDVVDFLLHASDKLVEIPEFGARWTSELVTAARPGVCVPVTAQVQIAVGADGVASCVVVNRVFDGIGWLAARFTAGRQPGQRKLHERMEHWLRQASGGREPVDVPLSGHCSDLQAHQRLTPRVLRWPGEPLTLPPSQVVEASALRIRHDPASGLLDVTDDCGTALNLLYLGTTFPSPIWGLRYALSILTQPYLIARPDFPPPLNDEAEPVRFEPRMTHGALVLRRATWWVSVRHLREQWSAGASGERLLRARRWCERHGVPPVFFAQRHIAAGHGQLIPADVLNVNRKPLWVDVRNPFWLVMLERLVEGADWVMLVEPLPGPNELWLELGGQRHVSELQMEMLITAGIPNTQPQQGDQT